MASTSLDTTLSFPGGVATKVCELKGFGLVATIRYSGFGGHNVEFAPGDPQRHAEELLGKTTDVASDTADYMALVVACEITRGGRFTA